MSSSNNNKNNNDKRQSFYMAESCAQSFNKHMKNSNNNSSNNTSSITKDGFLPMSGSEPPYEPALWNTNYMDRVNHNCYAYFLDNFIPGRPKRGRSRATATKTKGSLKVKISRAKKLRGAPFRTTRKFIAPTPARRAKRATTRASWSLTATTTTTGCAKTTMDTGATSPASCP